MWRKLTALALSALILASLTSCSGMAESVQELLPSTTVEETADTASDENTAAEEETASDSVQAQTVGSTETYTLSGKLTESLVIDTENAVEITLNNVTAELTDTVIRIKNAKSVTLILVGDSTLTSTAADTKTISSDVDLVIEGNGTLTVNSADTCIKADTNLTVNSGTLVLNAGSEGDGLRSDETLTINGGTISIEAGEGLESTQIAINDGTISITASDDGINGSQKSETLTPVVTINGGNISITVAQGDTDAIDCNGNIVIAGGTVNISGQSAFDADGTISYTSGTVYWNGQLQTSISNSMMGGGMMGGMPGQQGRWGTQGNTGEAPSGGSWGGQQPSGGPGGMHP